MCCRKNPRRLRAPPRSGTRYRPVVVSRCLSSPLSTFSLSLSCVLSNRAHLLGKINAQIFGVKYAPKRWRGALFNHPTRNQVDHVPKQSDQGFSRCVPRLPVGKQGAQNAVSQSSDDKGELQCDEKHTQVKNTLSHDRDLFESQDPYYTHYTLPRLDYNSEEGLVQLAFWLLRNNARGVFQVQTSALIMRNGAQGSIQCS